MNFCSTLKPTLNTINMNITQEDAIKIAVELALKAKDKYANDPSVIGANEVDEFHWGGVPHKMTVDAWWGGKRNYLDFELERIEDGFKLSDGFVKF